MGDRRGEQVDCPSSFVVIGVNAAGRDGWAGVAQPPSRRCGRRGAEDVARKAEPQGEDRGRHRSCLTGNGFGQHLLVRPAGQRQTILSIDPANGKIRWKQQYAAPYKMNSAAVAHGEGPKSTPLYSHGRLYTFGISGILSAFDAGSPWMALN